MAASVTFNPMQTTNTQQSFLLSSDGFVSGTFQDDPAIRYQLEGGVVSQSQSIAVWGGLPVSLAIPGINSVSGQPSALGSFVTVAATNAASNANGIHGFTVFNQAAAMIITPSSGVPVASTGMSVNFFRMGTNARIALPLSAGLANTLVGGAPTQQVSWDFVNQVLTTFNAGVGALPVIIETVSITSKVVSYNASTGAVVWNPQGPCAIVRI
jgi:hypothetical protein